MPDYSHRLLPFDALLGELDDALSRFTVDPDSRSSTEVNIEYTGDSGASVATLRGAGFRFDGEDVVGGTIDSIAFQTPEDAGGTITGLNLGLRKLDTLMETRKGFETWLLKQDWSSAVFSPFQPEVDVAPSTRIGDGVRFNPKGDDFFTGGFADDRMFGGGGDDIIYGNPGKDTLTGGTGNDTLKGGADADRLVGNGGKDDLYGGSGNDILIGGAGADNFRWEIDFGDTDLSLGGTDKIRDFEDRRDKIMLELESAQITGMGDVTISAKGANTLIKLVGEASGERVVQKILLLDTEADTIGRADFEFV